MLLDHFLRVHQRRRNRESKFEDGLVSGGGGFLRKKSDGRVLLDRDRSLIGRNLAENQREQGRFTSPIRADQSDPIAPINLERHVVKERTAGERF